MKIRTSELTGAALDWAVAKCEGVDATIYAGVVRAMKGTFGPVLAYSTDWSQGGPIIERENIYLCGKRWQGGAWVAVINCPKGGMPRAVKSGDTALVAAMRCYVASKLGDTIDIPEDDDG